MIGPTLLYLQKWQQVPVLYAVLTVSFLWHSTAIAEIEETDGVASIEFDCSVQNSEGEVLKIMASLDGEDQVSFKINEISVIGVLVPQANSHAPTIGFATSTFDGSVYTLAIHRAFYRPYPDGFDRNMPPATLTIQWTDRDITPVMDIFLGNCLVYQ